MLHATRMSLGAAPAAAYTCNILGTCSGTTVAQQQLFANLQRELNRVRAKYGLAPDVTVDGKIGTKPWPGSSSWATECWSSTSTPRP